MKHPKFLLPALIAVLFILIMAAALLLDRQSSPFAYRTPIPIATIKAYQPGNPINTPSQAFVAAQFYLGTTRLRAAGEILPYSAESMPFLKATARTTTPGESRQAVSQDDREVWLVLLEGAWSVEPPVPDATPTTSEENTAASRCVYVILDARDGRGMRAGGIRECTAYAVRPSRQIIQDLMRAKGLHAFPGTQAYGQLMKGIMLGEHPELTGSQATLVHNQAELDAVLEYATQHMQDGTWRLWEQPLEPDIPEALPPTATPRPTQSAPPQPVWYSPVITVPLPIPRTETIYAGEWLSEGRLQVKTHSFQSSGLYWIDLGEGDPYISTPRPAPASQQAYSSSSLYSVKCGNPLQMINVANQTVISQTDLILNPNAVSYCTAYVSWAGGEIAAFAARAAGEWGTYLWLSDGSPPIRVGPALNGARPPCWSPDGEQLAFMNYPESGSHTLQIMIVDRSGGLINTVPTSLVLQPTELRWLGQQVLALRNRDNLWQYYQAETGEVLFTWQEALAMGSYLDNQFPIVSPDGRWFSLERDGAEARGTLHKTYSLYNLQKLQESPFYDRPWHLLEFSGWSPDGRALFVIHRPAGPDATADPDIPYGLLAYHPLEGQFELLVENARAVYWDDAFHRAVVYVLTTDRGNQFTLSAGIWDPIQNRVTGTFPITNPPNQYDFLIAPSALHTIAPAAWSPDGRQAAFLTWQGDLLLMDLDGQTQLLASQVGLGRADFTRLLAWSPDGSYLFVSDRGTAWVLIIP